MGQYLVGSERMAWTFFGVMALAALGCFIGSLWIHWLLAPAVVFALLMMMSEYLAP